MSHPAPRGDYADKHNQETHKEYAQRKRKGEAKSKALHKVKEAPLQKLSRHIKESQAGRKDWRSMLGK